MKYSNRELIAKIDKLEEELQFQHKIINYSNDWEAFINPNKEIEYISPACKWITGYSENEFRKNPELLKEIIIDEDKKIADELFCCLEDKTSEISFEFRIKTKSGEIKWIELLCHKVFDKNNLFSGCFINNRDITTRKNKELESIKLKKLLQEERQLFHTGNVVVFKTINKAKWPITYISKNAESILGYTKEEIESDNFFFADLVHPDDIKDIKKRSETLKDDPDRNISEGSYRIITKNGQVKWIKNFVNVIRDKKNKIVYYTGYLIDITNEITHRNKLFFSEKKFEKSFHTCPNLHTVIDLKTRTINEVNKAFLVKMGYKKEEVIGKNATDILKIPEQSKNKIEKYFIEHGEIENQLTSVYDRNNNELKIELTAVLIEHNAEKKIFASASDITELFNKEILLKKLSIFAEYSSNSAILTDTNGIIQWVNPGFTNTKGYKLNEVKNKFYGDLFRDKIISEKFHHHFRKNQNYYNEFITYTKKGIPYWVKVELIFNKHINELFDGFIIIETYINELKNAEKKLEYYSNIQNLLLNIASDYLNPQSGEIKNLTNKALKDIGNFISADRGYIYFYDFDRQIAINKYNWTRNNKPEKFQIEERIKFSGLKEFLNKHIKGEVLYIKSTEEYEQSKLKDFLLSMRVKSIISLPLINNKKCFGFLGLDKLKHIKDFTGDELRVLKLFANILSNAFIKESIESELKTTNEFLSTIIDSAPVFITSFDKNHKCILWNKHAEQVFGYTKEELNMCDDLQKLFFPNSSQNYNYFEHIIKHNDKDFIKLQPVTKSGKKLEVLQSEYILPDKSTINIGYDITERIEYEKKIIESEARFKEFIETTRHIHIRCDFETLELDYVSPSIKNVLGYTVEEVKEIKFEWGKPNRLFDRKYSEQLKKLKKELLNLKTNADFVEKEYEIFHKNGNKKWIKATYYLNRKNNGKIKTIIGVLEDIDKEKQAEYKLKRSEETFRGLVERIDEVIFRMKIPEGKYEYFSNSAIDVLGYSNEEILKSPLFIKNVLHPDDYSYFEEKFREILMGIVRTTYEYRIIDKQNNTRWIKQSNKGIYDSKGRIIAVEGLCRNISNEKHAEQEIKQKIIEIEKYQKQLKLLNIELAKSEEKERKSIASYLHDGIGQILSIANIRLTSLDESKLSLKEKSVVYDTSRLLKEAINQTRTLTYDLDPPMLYEYGLRETLKWRMEKIDKDHKIKIRFEANVKELSLGKNEEIILYRVVNELLNNCIKHANASQLSLILIKKDNNYHIIVEDNGVGFSYNKAIQNNMQKGKFGLFNINERLDSINARIEFTSRRNKGTKAEIIINKQKN